MIKNNPSFRTPQDLPIIQKLIVAYKLWHDCYSHFGKLYRFGIGLQIDGLFMETIKNVFTAIHKPRDQKHSYLNKASDSFDLLKFILQVAWETKALDDKKYIALSQYLSEIGRMLGGWQKTTALHVVRTVEQR